MIRLPATARAQRGFTLVEILVTVVLISVGLLGVAALQLTTLRGNQESYVRSQASVLAADILDRMRANPTAFRTNEYNVGWNETGTGGARAREDLSAWQTAINTLLPGTDDDAAGQITRDAATNIVTVTIRWTERTVGDGTNIDTENGVRTFMTRSEI